MLTENDIDFLISGLDQLNFKGIQSSLKLNEVYLKLVAMKAEAAKESESKEKVKK